MPINYTDRTNAGSFVQGVNAKWLDGKTIDQLIDLFVFKVTEDPSTLRLHTHENLELLNGLKIINQDLYLNDTPVYNYLDDRNKKVLAFYIASIEKKDHSLSLFVPMKGTAIRMYVSLSKASSENLKISLFNSSEEIGNITILPGNLFSSAIISSQIDYSKLKVVANGEFSLTDINVLVDVVLETLI